MGRLARIRIVPQLADYKGLTPEAESFGSAPAVPPQRPSQNDATLGSERVHKGGALLPKRLLPERPVGNVRCRAA